MTEQEINTAIAEACGKVYHKPTEEEIKGGSYYQYEPNYCTDLNAMHEAEKALDMVPGYRDRDEVRDAYEFRLRKVVWEHEDFHQGFKVIHATARQRAEAFLRTIGKWRD